MPATKYIKGDDGTERQINNLVEQIGITDTPEKIHTIVSMIRNIEMRTAYQAGHRAGYREGFTAGSAATESVPV